RRMRPEWETGPLKFGPRHLYAVWTVLVRPLLRFPCPVHLARIALKPWLGALALFAQPASATVAEICDSAAQRVALESGVPLSVLRAITRVETGRAAGNGVQPWPWTVNMEGKGVWFDTEDEARAYVFREFKRG